MLRIHTVIASREIEEILREVLRNALRPDKVTFFSESDEKQARDRLTNDEYAGGPPDLFIIQSEIPRHPKSPLLEEELRGVFFAEDARQHYPDVPIIMIVHAFAKAVRAFSQKYTDVDVLELQMSWEEALPDIVRKHVRKENRRQMQYLQAIFTINCDSDVHRWELISEGVSNYPGANGPLQIKKEIWQKLETHSKYIAHLNEYPYWEEALQEIGRDLGRAIVSDLGFLTEFTRALTIAGGFKNIQICFSTDKKTHPIALEALLTEKKLLAEAVFPDNFWMLCAPFYRRIRWGTEVPRFNALDDNSRRLKLNCLIIQADLESATTELKPLRLAGNECRWLKKYLKERGPEDFIGQVELLDEKSCNSKPFYEVLVAKLQQEDWHIIHFAGHSKFEGDQGFLVVPGSFHGDSPKYISIADLGPYLNKTHFLYLSSCESAFEQFFFEIARHEVPAVLGFRWKVEDLYGFEFAQRFYEAFFQEAPRRRLEHAFLEARRQVKTKYGNKKIWASPMMILQSQKVSERLANVHV